MDIASHSCVCHTITLLLLSLELGRTVYFCNKKLMRRNLYTFSPALDNKTYDHTVAHVGKIYITKSTCEARMSKLKNMYIPELVSSKAEEISFHISSIFSRQTRIIKGSL